MTHDHEREGCGILLHQRPMLQDMLQLDHPRGWLFFESWLLTPNEPITDEGLRSATTTLDGKNLLFLKALVEGRPEIINIESEAGEFVTAETLRNANSTICVHQSNDPASGFYLRTDLKDVRILAPIRRWTLYSHVDPTQVGQPAASE